MPTKIYYFDTAQTDGVTASWSMFFRNFRLDYQGRELGRLTPAELKAGHEFALPDGRRLLVRLQQKLGAQGLDFQVDGRPLGGTVNDPLTQVNTAFAAIMLIAGLNVVLSAVAMLGPVETLLALGVVKLVVDDVVEHRLVERDLEPGKLAVLVDQRTGQERLGR